MLSHLRINNFAIIESLEISFDEGLTVLSGETGAGKSMILDAIQLLMGARGSAEFVRHGAEKAEIEALFQIEKDTACREALRELGINEDEGMLVIRRTISKNGKSLCRLNGQLVTIGNIRYVSQHLIDIHGQHEHQALMEPERHILLLDRFGGKSLKQAKSDYVDAFNRAQKVKRQLSEWEENEQEVNQRKDMLEFQINEILQADLKQDEETELEDERLRLANYESIHHSMHAAYEALNGEEKGLDWLRSAKNELESIQHLDSSMHNVIEAIASSFYILEENVFHLSDRLEGLSYDPDRLNVIEGRLNEIDLLKRKYGPSIPKILTYVSSIQQEYDQLENKDETTAKLKNELKQLVTIMQQKAKTLSEQRIDTAKKLDKAINAELKDLYMEKAHFNVRIKSPDNTENMDAFHKSGFDHVEFYISTNPGEPAKPLAKIASGGELSRIMLAIKSHFKSFQNVTSIIFDEVDTGVSGRVAQAMAEKVHHLSRASQIFCITHLPQIAAMSDHHLFIYKEVTDERTATQVKPLNDESKAEEIGRMVSGAEMTDLTIQHAEELLKMAKEMKATT